VLKTKDLRDWFVSEVPGIPGWMDKWPDGSQPIRVFTVSISGGLGLDTGEEALETTSFTLQTRGTGYQDAEEWAYALHNAWLDSHPMQDIGGYRVIGKGVLGGPPSFVRVEDVPQGAVIRAANYWCRIER